MLVILERVPVAQINRNLYLVVLGDLAELTLHLI
jgi:hypothetical protein